MNIVLDFEERNVAKVIDGLETLLNQIIDDSFSMSDADSFGQFDVIEHLTGLAFVALQTYITAVYGILGVDKARALAISPDHSPGHSLASIVNDAANYWKHNNEWAAEQSPKRREKIEQSFDKVGFPVGTDYPLSGVLTELSDPAGASFVAVFYKLKIWRTNIECVA